MTSPETERQAGYGQPPPVYAPGDNQQQYPMENINPAAPEPQGQNNIPDEAAASEIQSEKHDGEVLKSGLKSVPENYMSVSTACTLYIIVDDIVIT